MITTGTPLQIASLMAANIGWLTFASAESIDDQTFSVDRIDLHGDRASGSKKNYYRNRLSKSHSSGQAEDG
jgi:hypothetical protein